MNRFAIGVERLKRTEAHVLALVDSGLSNRQIAGALSITVGTVKCNLHRVYEKLHVRGRLEAVPTARDRGVLSLSIGTTTSVRASVAIEIRLPPMIARMWTAQHKGFVRPRFVFATRSCK